MKLLVSHKQFHFGKISRLLILSSAFSLYSCSGSGGDDDKKSPGNPATNGLGTPGSGSNVAAASPTPLPSGSATPTPSTLPGGEIPGLSTTTFPSFYVGVESRSNNPDPAPYDNFSMCFRGQFGQRAADSHVVALSDQTVSIDLRKTVACNYTFTLTAIAPDASKNQTVTRSMKTKQTQTISLPVVKGSVLEATIRIDNGAGGCDAGATRILYQTWTAVVPKTAQDCSN